MGGTQDNIGGETRYTSPRMVVDDNNPGHQAGRSTQAPGQSPNVSTTLNIEEAGLVSILGAGGVTHLA